MKRGSRVCFTLALGLLSVVATVTEGAAQDVPRAEVFGGFSYLRTPISMGFNLIGWQANPDINLGKSLALAFDFGGQYRSIFGVRLSQYEYAAGPRFKYRTGPATLFVHGLVGGDAAHAPSTTQGAFLLGFGGGLDFNVSHRLAIRAFQLDSLHDRTRGVWGHGLRVGVGVVFKAGRE